MMRLEPEVRHFGIAWVGSCSDRYETPKSRPGHQPTARADANLERETDRLLTAGPAMLQRLEQELVVVIGGLFEPSSELAVNAAREAGGIMPSTS